MFSPFLHSLNATANRAGRREIQLGAAGFLIPEIPLSELPFLLPLLRSSTTRSGGYFFFFTASVVYVVGGGGDLVGR